MNDSTNHQNKTKENELVLNEPNIYLFYTCNLTCDEELNTLLV